MRPEVNLTIVPGPHEGFWIKDGDKVLMWTADRVRAEWRLKEMEDRCKQ